MEQFFPPAAERAADLVRAGLNPKDGPGSGAQFGEFRPRVLVEFVDDMTDDQQADGLVAAQIADARALYAAMFPKGLQFLTLDFKDEWNESQQRLDHVTEARLDETLEALGGRPFLATVARAHRVYGEALHITPGPRAHLEGPDEDEPDAPVRRAIEATHLALREYVAHVAATVRRTEVDSVGTAARLLEPLSIRAGSADSYEALDDNATLVSFVG